MNKWIQEADRILNESPVPWRELNSECRFAFLSGVATGVSDRGASVALMDRWVDTRMEGGSGAPPKEKR